MCTINQIIFNGNKLTASVLVHSIYDGIKVGLNDIEYLLLKKKNQFEKKNDINKNIIVVTNRN